MSQFLTRTVVNVIGGKPDTGLERALAERLDADTKARIDALKQKREQLEAELEKLKLQREEFFPA